MISQSQANVLKPLSPAQTNDPKPSQLTLLPGSLHGIAETGCLRPHYSILAEVSRYNIKSVTSSFPVLPIILSHQVPRGKPCSLSTMTWMTFFLFQDHFQPFRTSFVWMCSVLEQSSTLWVTISLETCGLSYARHRGPWGWHYSCSHRAHGWPRTTHNYIGLRP